MGFLVHKDSFYYYFCSNLQVFEAYRILNLHLSFCNTFLSSGIYTNCIGLRDFCLSIFYCKFAFTLYFSIFINGKFVNLIVHGITGNTLYFLDTIGSRKEIFYFCLSIFICDNDIFFGNSCVYIISHCLVPDCKFNTGEPLLCASYLFINNNLRWFIRNFQRILHKSGCLVFIFQFCLIALVRKLKSRCRFYFFHLIFTQIQGFRNCHAFFICRYSIYNLTFCRPYCSVRGCNILRCCYFKYCPCKFFPCCYVALLDFNFTHDRGILVFHNQRLIPFIASVYLKFQKLSFQISFRSFHFLQIVSPYP